MADYYSILNKTITGLAKNTPEVRQAVYSKARLAIEAQLRKMDPPPAEELIANQLELLEEAILVAIAFPLLRYSSPRPSWRFHAEESDVVTATRANKAICPTKVF